LNIFPHVRKELINYYNILLKFKGYNSYEQHKDEIFDIVNGIHKKQANCNYNKCDLLV